MMCLPTMIIISRCARSRFPPPTVFGGCDRLHVSNLLMTRIMLIRDYYTIILADSAILQAAHHRSISFVAISLCWTWQQSGPHTFPWGWYCVCMLTELMAKTLTLLQSHKFGVTPPIPSSDKQIFPLERRSIFRGDIQ